MFPTAVKDLRSLQPHPSPMVPYLLRLFGGRATRRLMLLLVAATCSLSSGSLVADLPLPQRADADKEFQQQLQQLALRCDELKLAEQARLTRLLIAPHRSDQNRLYLPSLSRGLRPPAGSPAAAPFWYERLQTACRQQAARLFTIASQLVQDEQPAAAYRMLHEILYLDPNHAQAARILDTRTLLRSPRAERARNGHPQLGWAAQEYWTITSPNFTIVSDHSARAGIDLARQLEQLHTAWRQLLFDYWSDGDDLAARWKAKGVKRKAPQRHQVVLFKDRKKYVETLTAVQARIGLSTGYYQYDSQVAFFYMADPAPSSTWLHEVTHQLMQESRPVIAEVGRNQNFWIVEGIALYMESLRVFDTYCTVGGFESDRLQIARYRRLAENYYVPLEQLVLFGRDGLQLSADIREIYTQSNGLTHLLMDDRGGHYRSALVKYLLMVYQGKDETQSLAELCNRRYEQLDEEYGSFLVVDDADLAQLSPAIQLKRLILCNCPVSDAGLVHLKGQAELRQLDLTGTKATDVGFAALADSTRMEELFAAQTALGSKSLTLVASMTQLEALDLRGTKIDDGGLAYLAGLRKLKQLWLTSTAIGDEGIKHLESMKQLELLELTDTQVSEAAWQALEAKLPMLKKP